MPEISLDVAVANRFISSLSKSLQALCHGCMDFDNGIEIVGYINVNIDSGSKVDYVLNEKVLKSTTNSMTFVSNSFLAKKDQPKQTRDGSCSPVPELQQPAFNPASQYRGQFQGSGSQYPRSNLPYSSHSRVLRGSQKRSYPGGERDWRNLSRKHARGARQYSYPQDQSYPTTSQSYPSSVPTSETDPSSTATSGATDSADLGINIKQEKFETDEQSTSAEQTPAGDSSEAGDTNQSVNIKSDPDAPPPPDTEQTGDSGENVDIKQSFLEQPEDGDHTSALQTSNDNESEIPSFDTPFPVASGSEDQNQSATESNVASDSANMDNDNVASGSGMGADYDEQGDADYPHSSYADPEASGDGSGIDVIEIEDEDEDVQAIFGGSRMEHFSNNQAEQWLPSHMDLLVDFASGQPDPEQHNNSCHSSGLSGQELLSSCHMCQAMFSCAAHLKTHLRDEHKYVFPFPCSMCDRSFGTRTGLKQHEQCHGEPRYFCHCGAKFKFKHHLKRHILSLHRNFALSKVQDSFH